MIVTQNTKLNVVPGGIIPVVHASQYDVDRAISFTLYDGDGAANLENGTTVSIEGTKPDGHGFSYEGTLSGNVATFNTTMQMTVLVGAIECKLTLRKDSQVIGTAMFILDVEKAGLSEGTDISDTDIPMIISLATEQMERAEAAAVSANASMIASGSSALIAGNAAAICASILPVVQNSAAICASILPVVESDAASAEENALKAEGNAVGKQNGEDVGSESPYYHNNAKYWAEQAQQSAQGAVTGVKGNAEENYRDGNVNITPANIGYFNGSIAPLGGCVPASDGSSDKFLCADGTWKQGGGGGGTIVVVPTVTDTNPVYDGTQKTPTITRDTEHTTITGTYEATLPGNYTFTIFLSGVNDVWTDNTTAPKVYAWSVAVPDGSTITPINDIQTWLLCGGIVDKAYTTLNEVLADRDTLVKLMASDNAADYLVRSTSWVSGITANETAMGAIGASDYCSETLLSDSTWCAAIVASAYRSSVLNTEVPTMTSNTTPSGVASASSQSSTGYPWKAFDDDWTTGWGTATGVTTGAWLCYDFGRKVKGFVALVNSYASVAVKYVIEGSNDATTWTALTSEITGYVYDRTVKTSLFTQNVDEYRYYRFRCTGGGSGNLGGINMQIYGRNPGGVQTWLKAGSITDKNYITLSEVLADSTTLAALMLDSDAVDYLVTATSWADTITANQTAMTDIGVDDYCADTLLADSTWRTAICNSTYFESILNVKVPVMASNTTPSGVCSASNSNSSNEPWKAFDSSDSTAWTAAQNTSSGDSWLQYTFSNNIKAYKLYIKCSLGGSFDGVVAPRFQYYDNTTSAWVNLFTDIIRDNDTRIFQPCVSDKYRFIEARHVWIGDHSTYYSSYVYVIQIYGRASS